MRKLVGFQILQFLKTKFVRLVIFLKHNLYYLLRLQKKYSQISTLLMTTWKVYGKYIVVNIFMSLLKGFSRTAATTTTACLSLPGHKKTCFRTDIVPDKFNGCGRENLKTQSYIPRCVHVSYMFVVHKTVLKPFPIGIGTAEHKTESNLPPTYTLIYLPYITDNTKIPTATSWLI